MRPPGLHLVTDDAVLERPDFTGLAADLMACGGPGLAFHLRGHRTSARALLERAEALAGAAAVTATVFLVNDRVDVALAVAADGVQLGRRSAPVARVRTLIGDAWIGYSAHDASEAAAAERAGADFVVLGAVFDTATHPGASPVGPAGVASTAKRVRIPVIAIGGIGVADLGTLAARGASGVAVLGGVWRESEPLRALEGYLVAARVFDETGSRARPEGE